MGSEEIFFSVIIPAYNRAHTLLRSVESVLAQTYRNFELIIVDDGSKDDTSLLVKKIQERDSRVRFFCHEVNKGQNASLNSGLSLVEHDYVTFLDSDDEWEKSYLEEMMLKFKESPDIDCVYCSAKNLIGEPPAVSTLEGSFIYPEALSQGYISTMITIAVKRKCVEAIGGFDEGFTVCQDDDFCLRLAKTCRFAVVKKHLAIIHKDAGNQVTMNSQLNLAKGWEKLFLKFKDDIVFYCGSKTLAKQYFKLSILFLNSKCRMVSLRYFIKFFFTYLFSSQKKKNNRIEEVTVKQFIYMFYIFFKRNIQSLI